MIDVATVTRTALDLVGRWCARTARFARAGALVAGAIGIAVWLLQDRAWPRGTSSDLRAVLLGVCTGAVLLVPAAAFLFVWRRARAAGTVREEHLRRDLEELRTRAADAYADVAAALEGGDRRRRGTPRTAALVLWKGTMAVRSVRNAELDGAAQLVRPFLPSTFLAAAIGIGGTLALAVLGLPIALLL